MGVIEIVIAVLATWQIVEVWHHSSIMASWRARVELWDNRFPWGFSRDVLVCPYCLSVWIAWLAFAFLKGGPILEQWLLNPWSPAGRLGYLYEAARWTVVALLSLARVFIWGLAISRAANLGNDLTRSTCRTPRTDLSFEPPAVVTEGVSEVPSSKLPFNSTKDEVPMSAQQTTPPGHVLFDQSIVDTIRPAVVDAFLKHGDVLRSVGIFLDYYGPLNQTPNILHGLWLGPQGSVGTPDGIMGSLEACQLLQQQVMARAVQIKDLIQERLEIMLQEIKQRSSELEGAQQAAQSSPDSGGATGGDPSVSEAGQAGGTETGTGTPT